MNLEGYKVTSSTGDDLIGIVRLFTVPWVVMLCLGTLGHHLEIPYLFKFSYWNTWLIYVVATIFRTSPVLTWRIKKG